MGIKSKRVTFVFDESKLHTLTPEEVAAHKQGRLPTTEIRPSQESTYAARRKLSGYNICPCCHREIPEEWRR